MCSPAVAYLFCFIITCIELNAQVCHGTKVLMTENGSCPSDNLNLVFEDNFDGDSLDKSLWYFTQPWCNHSINGFNSSLEYQTDGLNYEFVDGKLRLMVKEEKIYAKAIKYHDSDFTLNDGLPNLRWWSYTAGMIYSKQDFGLGKYEIRCKIPKGKGFWCVFWLYGENNEEIDVFEFWNETNITGKYDPKKLSRVCHMTTHRNDDMCASHVKEDDFSDDFHTFTLSWTNNKIEWYIDGKLKRVSTKFYSLLGQPLDCSSISVNEMYIQDKTYPLSKLHISVSLGIQMGKNKPDDTTPFPSYLEIDYIRFWGLH